tara:strand:+ start:3364 stop:3612 length:249 start_codon:yes stop_codon:yes gene_type:complete
MSLPDDYSLVELFVSDGQEPDEQMMKLVHRITASPPNLRGHPDYELASSFAKDLRENYGREEALEFFSERCVEMVRELSALN